MALRTPPTGSTRGSYNAPTSVSTPTPPPTQGPTTTTTTTTQGTVVPVPQELEQTLSALSSHRSVLGYLLIARGGGGGGLHSASIIRHSGVVFEGEKGRKYAGVIARIVENVQAGLEEVNSSSSGGGGGGIDESSEADEVRFMRIRTKRHEIMISPDERFLLAVLHDPTVT